MLTTRMCFAYIHYLDVRALQHSAVTSSNTTGNKHGNRRYSGFSKVPQTKCYFFCPHFSDAHQPMPLEGMPAAMSGCERSSGSNSCRSRCVNAAEGPTARSRQCCSCLNRTSTIYYFRPLDKGYGQSPSTTAFSQNTAGILLAQKVVISHTKVLLNI